MLNTMPTFLQFFCKIVITVISMALITVDHVSPVERIYIALTILLSLMLSLTDDSGNATNGRIIFLYNS